MSKKLEPHEREELKLSATNYTLPMVQLFSASNVGGSQ